MVEVNPQGLTLLAEVAIPMAELDAAALAKQIKNAEEDLADAKPGEAKPQGDGSARPAEGAAVGALKSFDHRDSKSPGHAPAILF